MNPVIEFYSQVDQQIYDIVELASFVPDEEVPRICEDISKMFGENDVAYESYREPSEREKILVDFMVKLILRHYTVTDDVTGDVATEETIKRRWNSLSMEEYDNNDTQTPIHVHASVSVDSSDITTNTEHS